MERFYCKLPKLFYGVLGRSWQELIAVEPGCRLSRQSWRTSDGDERLLTPLRRSRKLEMLTRGQTRLYSTVLYCTVNRPVNRPVNRSVDPARADGSCARVSACCKECCGLCGVVHPLRRFLLHRTICNYLSLRYLATLHLVDLVREHCSTDHQRRVLLQ